MEKKMTIRTNSFAGRRAASIRLIWPGLALAGLALAGSSLGTPQVLPVDPLEGSQVFIDKGCIKCHTIWGIGDEFGPDLTRIGRRMSFFELAGAFWSHSPKMLDIMRERDIEPPLLSPEEMEKLITYIYFLGFFEELGDYAQGERIFSERGCENCHALGKKEDRKISLNKYGRYISPVFIAADLWNHSDAISRTMQGKSFAPLEMSHLLAYIRGEALTPGDDPIYLPPGNPRRGKEVFLAKKCASCHGEDGQSLKNSPLRRGLTEIVGMMWSHSFEMWNQMQARGLNIPRFESQEMADLLSFLYFLQYYEGSGDAAAGERIFAQKGCISCHSREAVAEKKGVDLREAGSFTASQLISVMWNHMPAMERMMTELNLNWPRFQNEEMKDLIYFLLSQK